VSEGLRGSCREGTGRREVDSGGEKGGISPQGERERREDYRDFEDDVSTLVAAV